MLSDKVNSKWTTCGRKLLLNGKSYFVRGVNYTPIRADRCLRLDLLDSDQIFTRDLQNLRAIKANAVKVHDFASTADLTTFLDAAFNSGVNPIYTVISIHIDHSLMQSVVATDSNEFKSLVESYYRVAKLTAVHPAVMGYSIGDEINSIFVTASDATFWSKFALLTGAIRKGLAENGHAQKIITTSFVDDGGISFMAGEQFQADVDIWGSHVYQTNYAGSIIPTYTQVPGQKPLLVADYSVPYFASGALKDTTQELRAVGELLAKQATALEANFNLTDRLKEQVVVGGFVAAYSDQWWRARDEKAHYVGAAVDRQPPTGKGFQEHFGLYRFVPSNEESLRAGRAPSDMEPLPAVEMLKEVWNKGRIGGEGIDYSDCRMALAALEQTALRRRPSVHESPSVFGLFVEGMFAVVALCALGLLAFAVMDTRTRRSRYRRLKLTTLL